jgi:hypothetical protein
MVDRRPTLAANPLVDCDSDKIIVTTNKRMYTAHKVCFNLVEVAQHSERSRKDENRGHRLLIHTLLRG